MFLSRDSLLNSSADWVERYEKVHKNLVKRTRQLKSANRELVNQIAERKQVEKALRQAERKYRSIFENAVEGIFQTTPDGRYIDCNPALARIYGYESPEELLISLTDIGRQLYVEPHRRYEFIKQLHSQDCVSEFESQVYRKDGRIIWICENARAVRDDDGTLLYYEGFVTDISKRKATEAALLQSEAQLKIKTEHLELALNQLQQTQNQLMHNDKMANLGQLVAGIAHEINNPVNFVCGNLIPASQYTEDLLNLLKLYAKHYPQPELEIQLAAEAIDLDFLFEDFPKTLSSMQLGADRIRQIVQSLGYFSRLDEAEMKPVDLHQGIDSTLLIINNRLKPNGDNPGITVIKEYGDLPLVKCYAGLLNQVFMNLLSNAIDALEASYPKRSGADCFEDPCIALTSQVEHPTIDSNIAQHPKIIRIHTEVVGGDSPDGDTSGLRAVVKIVDNGLGMSEEVKAQVFNPFFTTKPLGKGTGLGLSISHQIVVEKHGGRLSCISAIDRGTEFRIEIPIRP